MTYGVHNCLACVLLVYKSDNFHPDIAARDRLDVNNSTRAAVQRALEAAGVEFIAENGGGPGVRLKKKVSP